MKPMKSIVAMMLGAGLAQAAPAAEATPFAMLAVVHSDNAGRTPVGHQSAEVVVAEVGGDLFVDTSSNYAFLRAAATGFKFASAPDSYKDEIRARLDGDWIAELLPDRVRWVTKDSYGQLAGRSYRQIQAGNREDVNVFSSGPQVDIKLGAQTSVGAALRYLNTDYSRTALDNHGYSAALAGYWHVSARHDLSLHAEQEKTTFASSSNPSDSVRNLFVRWDGGNEATRLAAQIGTARADDGRRTWNAMTYVFDVRGKVGAYSEAEFSANRAFEGASSRARLGSLSGLRLIENGTDTLLSADEAIVDRWQAGWITQRPRDSLRILASATRYNYVLSDDLDRIFTVLELSWAHKFTATNLFQARLGYDRDKSSQSGVVTTLFSPGIEFTHMGRKIASSLSVDHYRQEAGSRIGEWRAALVLRYPANKMEKFGGRYAGMDARIQQIGTEFARRPMRQPAR